MYYYPVVQCCISLACSTTQVIFRRIILESTCFIEYCALAGKLNKHFGNKMESLEVESEFIRNYLGPEMLRDSVLVYDGAEGRYINFPGVDGLADVAILVSIAKVPPSNLEVITQHPGYCKIVPWFKDDCGLQNFVTSKGRDRYLSSSLFGRYENFLNLQLLKYKYSPKTVETGRARSLSYTDFDPQMFAVPCTSNEKVIIIIPTIKCEFKEKYLTKPCIAEVKEKFGSRVVTQLLLTGCHLVPRCRFGENTDIQWKMSFSEMENIFFSSWTPFQHKCFQSVKTLLRSCLNIPLIVTGHKIKTLMFWATDRKPPSIWKQHPVECIAGILEDFTHALVDKNLPNYIFPNQNLLQDFTRDQLVSVAMRMKHIKENVTLQLKGNQFFYCPFDHYVLPLLHIVYCPENVIDAIDSAIAEILIIAFKVLRNKYRHIEEGDILRRMEILFHAYSYVCCARLGIKCLQNSKGSKVSLDRDLRLVYIDLLCIVANFCWKLKDTGPVNSDKLSKEQLLLNDIHDLSKGTTLTNAFWCEFPPKKIEFIFSAYTHFLCIDIKDVEKADKKFFHDRSLFKDQMSKFEILKNILCKENSRKLIEPGQVLV